MIDKAVAIFAKRGSGKSVLARHIISQYKTAFDRIFLISPTEGVNHEFEQAGCVSNDNIFHDWSEEWCARLMQKMEKVNEGKTGKSPGFRRVLLVLDDAVQDTRFHDCDAFKRIFTRGRHLGISIIVLSQSVTLIPPAARSNCDFVLISQLSNASLQCAAENFSNGIDAKEFKRLYTKSTIDFTFLLINMTQTKGNTLAESYGTIKAPSDT